MEYGYKNCLDVLICWFWPLCQFWLVDFSPHQGSHFPAFCEPGNFWSETRCEFYLVGCQIFLYLCKYSLFWDVIKILWFFWVWLLRFVTQDRSRAQSRANRSPWQRQMPSMHSGLCLRGNRDFFPHSFRCWPCTHALISIPPNIEEDSLCVSVQLFLLWYSDFILFIFWPIHTFIYA